MSKTWFVTGASRGLGREFVRAALERGDRVAATARSTDALADLVGDSEQLLRLPLDVTDSPAVQEALTVTVRQFGVLDVIVNNAATGHQGAVEELSDSELRSVMEVNFFGAATVTRLALPILRAQRHGHLITISSLGGVVALPLVGAYIASKWALEGFTEALALEVADLGIAVTLVEPGPFATGQGEAAMGRSTPLAAYEPLRQEQVNGSGPAPGDPAAAAQALLRVVDASTPPRRVIFGDGGLELVTAAYERRLSDWRTAAGSFGS